MNKTKSLNFCSVIDTVKRKESHRWGEKSSQNTKLTKDWHPEYTATCQIEQ